jgi:hypothetical protein
LLDSLKLWNILKASPAYGRLAKEDDLGSSTPAGTSPPLKKLQPAMVTSSFAFNNPKKMELSELLKAKAVARRVPTEKLQALYQEKQKLATDRYASNHNQEWLNWFVEASVWGHLCRYTHQPFFLIY